ncbi:hypothetical protein A2U01_0073415, partial [Trifolium medium]|nr:hypothetical protein [Trifolium medium]
VNCTCTLVKVPDIGNSAVCVQH